MKPYDEETNKIIGIVLIFALAVLLIIFNSGMRLVEKLMDSNVPKITSTLTPASLPIALPNPRQLYFIDCVDGDKGLIITKKGMTWYYACEKGEWEEETPL